MADELNVAAELARLRGEVSTGFAEINGQLALIAQAQSRVSDDLDDLDGKVDALDERVAALEARRIPLAPLAAASGAVSAIVAVVAILVQ